LGFFSGDVLSCIISCIKSCGALIKPQHPPQKRQHVSNDKEPHVSAFIHLYTFSHVGCGKILLFSLVLLVVLTIVFIIG
jgi:hypothetical protein